MSSVNIHRAKTHLSRLVDEVSAGREIIIAKAGKPAARLVPLERPKVRRKPGFLKGKLKIAADFDAAMSPAIIRSFEGRR